MFRLHKAAIIRPSTAAVIHIIIKSVAFIITLWLLTDLLTYSMEQSPSLEANCSAASQEIPRIFGTRRFITVLTSARHLSLS